MFDPAPEEPDEPNPEDRWGDPERELPSTPETSSVEGAGGDEVPTEVATAFWSVLLLVNVGVLAVALGPMLVLFRGRSVLGGAVLALGGVALLHAYRRYRRFRNRDRGDDDGEEGDPKDDLAGAAGGSGGAERKG